MIFTFSIPTQVHFGPGAIDETGKLVRLIGERAVVVTGRSSARANGISDRIARSMNAAGVSIAGLFEGIEPHPTTDAVDTLAAQIRFSGAEVVVAVGGGSVIDAAKAAARLSKNDGRCAEYLNRQRYFQLIGMPLVAIPTTAGAGAEMTDKAVLRDPARNLKRNLACDVPEIAVVDPELTHTLSPRLTAETGIGALAMGIESIAATGAIPPTVALARESIRLIDENLLRAIADGRDSEARTSLSWGAVLAGAAMNVSGLGLAHALARSICACFRAPHGAAMASVLPAVMRYNLQAARPAYESAARAFGLKGEAESAIAHVETLLADLGLKRNIHAFGAEIANLESIARDAASCAAVAGNPRQAEITVIIELLKSLL